MGRYIKINENNKISTIRLVEVIADGEIESESGEIGQIMQLDK